MTFAVRLPFGRALGAAMLVAGVYMIWGLPAVLPPDSFADGLLTLTAVLYSVGLVLLGLTLLVGSPAALRALGHRVLLPSAIVLALSGVGLGWIALREPDARSDLPRALIALVVSAVALRAWRQSRHYARRETSPKSGAAS